MVRSSFVSPALRDRIRGLAVPIAVGLGRLGLTPNVLTILGFLGTGAAAVALANQQWVLGGVLVLVFGIFDLFDGTLARATGKASPFGAFLDSTFDRLGEGVVYVGIVGACLWAGFRDGGVLAASAMVAAFMVSYTRARAESLGFSSGAGLANVGLAPREVRIVILAVTLIATGLAGGIVGGGLLILVGYELPFGLFIEIAGGRAFLEVGLALITLLALITTAQRIIHVMQQASKQPG